MQEPRSCAATIIILHRTIDAYIEFHDSGANWERNTIMLLAIIRFLHSWKRYGSAVKELSNLSDRELADIGITRSDIPRLAWEHAQA
jgi:uncharacterized protein YjiS (DUF1127 family)